MNATHILIRRLESGGFEIVGGDRIIPVASPAVLVGAVSDWAFKHSVEAFRNVVEFPAPAKIEPRDEQLAKSDVEDEQL